MNKFMRKNQMESPSKTQGKAMASTLGILVGLLIGGLSATVATLLLAPRSGRHTRSRIRHQVQELRNSAAESVDDAEEEMAERAEAVTASVRDTVETLQKRGKAMLNER